MSHPDNDTENCSDIEFPSDWSSSEGETDWETDPDYQPSEEENVDADKEESEDSEDAGPERQESDSEEDNDGADSDNQESGSDIDPEEEEEVESVIEVKEEEEEAAPYLPPIREVINIDQPGPQVDQIVPPFARAEISDEESEKEGQGDQEIINIDSD